MNELKRKLEFRNNTFTIQCLCKLSQDLAKKCTTRIDRSTQDIPELTQILDSLCAEDGLESQLSGQVILHLVEADVLDLTFALDSVLISAPSGKNLIGAVEAIFGLLVLQSRALMTSGSEYRCPYTLRGPTHPLISVLTNRPDSWPFLVGSSSALLSHRDKRVNSLAIEILRPFLLYVFVEPAQSVQFCNARTGLWRVLMTAVKYGPGLNVVEFCLSFLPAIPNKTGDQLLSVSQMIVDFIEVLIPKLDDITVGNHSTLWTRATEVLLLGLNLILGAFGAGAPAGDLTRKLCSLAQRLAAVVEVCSLCYVKADATLLLMSEILDRASFFDQNQLIELAHQVISLCHLTCQRICLATVIKPLVQTVASPALTFTHSGCQGQENTRAQAAQLLAKVEHLLDAHTFSVNKVAEPLHGWALFGQGFHLAAEVCQQLVEAPLDGGDGALAPWLRNVARTLDRAASCPLILTHIASAALVTARSDVDNNAALELVKRIAAVDPKQAIDFLPFLLYVLSRAKSPERKLDVLLALPSLATHKLCIPPVLKTILALSKSQEVKPISIRLMTLLWKQQDRCFPQLLQLISETQVQASHQVSLAKAAAILEICQHKPEQHGADLLTPLSDILRAATTEPDTPISVMALQGLSRLCEAEVMDLMSLWSYLGETFLNESRPLVVKEICGLLSLVPQLSVETEDYEQFTKESVLRLWKFSQSSSSVIAAASFEALSHYSPKHFCVSHLPKSVTVELYEQAKLAEKQMQEEKSSGQKVDTVDVDVMFQPIPGSCFISILQSLTDPEVIAAYRKLLQTLMAAELSDLPRGVYFTACKKNLPVHGGKALEKVPSFLLQKYNNCRQPGLRPGTAAGLLFCYDPPLEVARDGQPRKHYVIRHGKTFLEMFVTLLQEVPIQTTDWHRVSFLTQAWNSFMERLFFSLLESRRADLELQEKHGHISATDLAEKNIAVWLATRDSILDAIKTTSRGSPSAQANCVLSLASLALCLHKYVTDLDSELFKASQEKTEYIGHSHWLAMTVDTILSFSDQNYIPKGKIHNICHQKTSTQDVGQPSSLCCAVARLATSQLVPLLVASDSNKIVQILGSFTSCLPNGQSALDSPAAAFCNGLALGMMLEGLFNEHFSEMTGSRGMLAVWKALTALEEIAYRPDMGNVTGCIVGLARAICAMCADGKTESRVHSTAVLEKLIPLWMDMSSEADYFQALTFIVACVTTAVYSTNTLDIGQVLPFIEKLKQVHQAHPQYSGVCLSLGLIVFSLHRLGVEVATSLRKELITSWLKDIIQEETQPAEKIAKLNGLFSIIGSEQLLFPVVCSSAVLMDDCISEVVSTATSIVSGHDDLGLQSASVWMLGHLYLSSVSSGGDRCTSVPGSFNYLPDWSILRAVYDFLLEAGRAIPDCPLVSKVNVCLQALNVKVSLPPVNWALMFSPFMRNTNFGDEIKTKILQAAVQQLQSSPVAVVFISSWLTPPLYSSLQPSSKMILHLCMPHLIRSVSPGVLKVYLERSCLPELADPQNSNLQLTILQGLKDALTVTDPPAAVMSLLYDATAQFYLKLNNELNVALLKVMSDCLCLLPDDLMDAVIAADFSDASTQVKGCFVRCYMVVNGRQSLALLNYMIDAFFNADYWDQKMGMFLLLNCLIAHSKKKGESSSLSTRQQWFLELLGHTRTVIIGAMPLAETAPSKDKVIRYIANIVSAATLALTYPSYTDLGLWGQSPKVYDPTLVKLDGMQMQTEYETVLPNLSNLYSNTACFLPGIISSLSTKQWESILAKAIDWLIIVSETEDTDLDTRKIINAALMSLHNTPAFRSVAVWTKVIHLTHLHGK